MVHHFHGNKETVTTEGRTIHWAQRYDHFVRLTTLGQDRKLRKITVELAQVQTGERVLDVGCGTGDLTLLAKKYAGATGSVVGIDAAPEMIDVARTKAAERKVQVEFRVEAIEKLSFADETFDVVLSSLMMHHLPSDLKALGLKEIRRVLKPGGRLLIVDIRQTKSLYFNLMFNHVLGHMSQGFDDLPAMLWQAGFTAVETGATKLSVAGYVRGRA